MLMPADADLRRLTRLYRALAPAERRTLLAFAAFLAAGGARELSQGSKTTGTPAGPDRLPWQDTDAAGVPLVFDPMLRDEAAASASAADEPAEPPSEPLQVPPRPAGESVVAAIRRLSGAYAMLDRGVLLHETSALMSAHVLQGREAGAVIDDLEALFARRFAEHKARKDGADRPAPGAEGTQTADPVQDA